MCDEVRWHIEIDLSDPDCEPAVAMAGLLRDFLEEWGYKNVRITVAARERE